MDTQYSNILEAIKQADNPAQSLVKSIDGTNPTSDTAEPLSLEKRANNYKVFDALMKQGVDLEKIVAQSKQTEALQKQVESMKKNDIDAELFSIMESAVKNEPEVREARQRASEVKTKIITEICLKSPEYAEALHQYRRAVNQAYISKKEEAQGKEVQLP